MKKQTLATLVLLTAGFAPAVHAQDGAAYYGISFGEFDYAEGDDTGSDFIDDTVSSWRLTVAYQFNEHLAFEGGYGQTGTMRSSFTVPTFPSGTVDLDFSAEFSRILNVRLLGVLPLDNVKLMAGLGYSDVKFEFDLTDGVDTLSGDESSNELGYYFGVQYDWDRFAMRLGYEKFDFDGDVDASETMLTFFYKI
jgi:opacity protein-like surface antigen